jgi:hypothetical protein
VSSEFNSKVAWRVKNSLPPFPPFLREERMGIGGREEGMGFLLIYELSKVEH